MTKKQFSPASARNREPILAALRGLLQDCRSVLEIVITALPLLALWTAALLMVRQGWWWGVALTPFPGLT